MKYMTEENKNIVPLKVSIVVPVFNVESYLHECVQSVLNQNYNNVELILVNDGSKDRSGEICDLYVEQYPDTIKVIHKENQGLLLTRMRGIAVATGKIILFLDSDDCLRKDAVEILVSNFLQYKCDMILFNASSDTDYHYSSVKHPFMDGQLFCANNKKTLLAEIIMARVPNSVCLKAITKRCIDATRDYSKFSFVSSGEDLLVSLPFLTRAEKILFLDENLYYYRQREGSIVHTFNKERHKSIKAVHQELERYIDLWGMGTYHSKHYAREVRGWIETLVQLLNGRSTLSEDEYRVLLDELATDEYFRHAYEKMDASMLRKEQVLLADWLYKKHYTKIHLLYGLRKMVKGIRKI